MFEWLFKKKVQARSDEFRKRVRQQTHSTPIHDSLRKTKRIRDEGDSWLSIPAIGFYGPYVRSPNGRYRIAWRDGGIDCTDGAYILIKGDDVICQGQMERPQDGKVANNGNFILNDWRASSDLTGTFQAYRENGSKILAQKFSANLFNNGISADGRFAVCHTCNSDVEHDSAILAVFDLINQKELHRFRAESGWPNSYRFLPDGATMILGYSNGGGEFAYKLDGTFVDRDAWIDARLNHGDLLMVQRLLAEAGGKPSLISAKRLVEAVTRGLAHKQWQEKHWQALGFRMLGELQEVIGELRPAIESYDRALALNAKIGIKRRANQLRKSMSAPHKRYNPE